MPTEYRSSNTEMVRVPDGFMLVERSIWTEQQVEAATACITRLKGVPGMRDCDLAMAAIDAAQCKAPDIALSDLIPAQQPHPDPIAWMVGTAIWWTNEEAERDAAETGLPIVGLGPMAGVAPAEQHQGEPVAWRGINELGDIVTEWIDGAPPATMVDLCGQPASFASLELAYTHADPGEVERLRSIERSYGLREALLEQVKGERDRMIARTMELAGQLANQDALLHKLKEALQREYWDEYAGLDETRELIDAALAASAEPQVQS